MDPSMKKNSYELLSIMSSSDSDTPQQIEEINFKSRRKRLRKRLPSGRSRNYQDIHGQKCCHSHGRMISLSFIIIILCCWLLILSWLIVVFNDELKRYDDNLMAIVAGNQGIPESLQKCHVETEELQRHQSDLYTQFMNLSAKMTNLTTEVSSFSDELQKMRDRLKNTVDDSGSLKELSYNIPFIHDRIDELNNTVAQLKVSENSLEAAFLEFQQNLTSLRENSLSLVKVPNKIYNVSLTETNDAFGNLSLLVGKLYSNMSESLNEIHAMKQSPLLNSNNTKILNELLNQNISIRLDTVENEFSLLSETVFNLTKTYQINNTWKATNNGGTDTTPVTSNGKK